MFEVLLSVGPEVTARVGGVLLPPIVTVRVTPVAATLPTTSDTAPTRVTARLSPPRNVVLKFRSMPASAVPVQVAVLMLFEPPLTVAEKSARATEVQLSGSENVAVMVLDPL